jgi:hypothetical protein
LGVYGVHVGEDVIFFSYRHPWIVILFHYEIFLTHRYLHEQHPLLELQMAQGRQ